MDGRSALRKAVTYTQNERTYRGGAVKSLALQRTQQATGWKKCIYIFPPELHTLMTSLF
jgi:hypothetical protein